ncbi:MAG: hypothetical protein ISR80_03930 [Nitrosopumilus sp.]|nr:hypothetical protein [Nitrosopumilus sp.]
MAGYLGDTLNMIVHHLAMMTPECKIHFVKKVNRVYFVPDTLEQTIKEKFIPCKHCNDKPI